MLNFRAILNQKTIVRAIHKRTVQILSVNGQQTNQCLKKFCNKNYEKYDDTQRNHWNDKKFKFIAFGSLWSFITGKTFDEEEKPEDLLVANIKRGVLSIQRGDYKTAEKLLHVALKMAQDLQNSEGITYIYDVLANLAMEAGDFEKAEKLFVQVMQRMFGEGYKEDSMKMLHISAKLAHMYHFKGVLEKAQSGFEWTLEKLEEKLKKIKDDKEVQELYGLTRNWYAQLLMDQNLFKDARRNFEDAYKIYTEIHGDKTQEGVMLLNNLSVACTEMDDLVAGIDYLKQAIELAKEIPKMTEIGIFHANLGLLLLKQALFNEAEAACKLGFRLGTSMKNDDAVKQSSYCLNRIKELNK